MFHVCKGISYEFQCLFPWLCFSHDSFTLYVCVYSWFLFHEHICALCFIDFECQLLCDFHVFMGCMIWFHILKDFLLVFKNIFKLVSILQMVEFSNYAYLLSNHNFWKPLPFKGGWMGDHALYTLLEYLLNLCMIRGGKYELYTWSSLYFYWYQNWYFICLYTHMCFLYM